MLSNSIQCGFESHPGHVWAAPSVRRGSLRFVYSDTMRQHALQVLADCSTVSEASRRTGINRATLRHWRDTARPPREECPKCDEVPMDLAAYAALLGFYLGDGCISRMPRCYSLRVSCDVRYPRVIDGVEGLLKAVHPGRRVFRVPAPGCVVVQSNWQHWRCLFPQHGPGRKHDRPIFLEDWQRSIVEAHPAPFLRGLFHSDGCRVNNWTRRVVAGEWKRYHYPRWQFTNHSADIRELCCWALDLVDIAWRQSNWKTISVSTRAGVARLDGLIGLKS
jgi:hypothetical protein